MLEKENYSNFCNFKKKDIRTQVRNTEQPSANTRSSFFNTTGENGFFSQTHQEETPFFTKNETDTIQKSEEDGETAVQDLTPGDNAEYIGIRNEMIQLACIKMMQIREAAENGLIWQFEDEDLILGSEIVDRGAAGVSPLLDQRAEVLGEAINGLAQLVAALENGSYQIEFSSGWHWGDLAVHVNNVQTMLGLPEQPAMYPWTEHPLPGGPVVPYGFFGYITTNPGSTTALPSSTIPWWASIMPEACSGPEAAAPGEDPVNVSNTPFWVHIPDLINRPDQVDWIDRDFPRSGTGLQTPPTGTTQITGHGDSFPLMREGGVYFYRLNGRRIDLPGLQRRFPQLAE